MCVFVFVYTRTQVPEEEKKIKTEKRKINHRENRNDRKSSLSEMTSVDDDLER